ERGLAQFLAQYVQDARALSVDQLAAERAGGRVGAEGEGAIAAGGPERFVARAVQLAFALVRGAAPAPFLVGRGHEDGERLLDPEAAPGRAGGAFPPPLMPQPVRGEPVLLRVCVPGGRELLAQRGPAGHLLRDAVADEGDAVATSRERHAARLREE